MLRHFATSRNRSISELFKNVIRYQRSRVRWSNAVANGALDEPKLASAKPFEAIPHFRIMPVIGSAWMYLPVIGCYDIRKPYEAIRDKRRLLGDVFREKLGPFDIVVSFNADDIPIMIKNEGPYPSRGGFSSLQAYRESRKDMYLNTGLLILNGKEWYDLRSKVQKHMMKPKAVQAYLNPMQDIARDFLLRMKKIRDGSNEMPNFLQELYKWALESVCFVGLDTRLGCFESDLSPESEGMRMINSIQTLFYCIYKMEPISGNVPLWKWIPTPLWKKFANAGDTFTEIAFKYIKQAFDDMKKRSGNEDKDLTLLQCMLLEKGLEASGAMVTVADMLFAGIDTTSHSVGFFLYNIARNPEKQELLHQEITRLLPKKEDRITKDIFNEFKYLKACMKESFRLNPIVGGIGRQLANDVVISGYQVPAGVLVLSPLQEIGREEKHFRNADKFIPERWLNKDENFHPYSFLPFGFGVRSCVGRRLAELEIMCILAEILRNFEVQYHYEDIGVVTNVINAPDKPLRYTFIER